MDNHHKPDDRPAVFEVCRMVSSETLSGEWHGYYMQGGTRYPHDQRMEFADGLVRGDGVDDVGSFEIDGRYDPSDPASIHLGWIKTYLGRHSVLYLGRLTGRGITGQWDIGGFGAGFAFAPKSQPIPDV